MLLFYLPYEHFMMVNGLFQCLNLLIQSMLVTMGPVLFDCNLLLLCIHGITVTVWYDSNLCVSQFLLF